MIRAVVKDNQGNYCLNQAVKYARPYWLTTIPSTIIWPAQALAAGDSTGAQLMQLDSEAPFIGRKLVGQATNATTGAFVPTLLTIFDQNLSRAIARDPIHWSTIVGIAREPFVLLDDLFVQRRDSIRLSFKRVTAVGAAADDQVKFYVEGYRLYDRDSGMDKLVRIAKARADRYKASMLTFHTTDIAPVVLAAPALPAVTVRYLDIPENYHFTVKKITACLADGTAPFAAPPAFTRFLMRVFDQRGKLLSPDSSPGIAGTGGWLDSSAILSNGNEPEVLVHPWTIPANTRATVEFANLSGGANTFYITFTGSAQYMWG